VIYRPIAAAIEAAIKAKDRAVEGAGYATRKAREISSVVQDSVGPSLSKASEELPRAIQKISGTIGKAAGGAKGVSASYWAWVKNEVEGRRK